MKKRIISSILSMIIIITIAVGCSTGDEGSQTTEQETFAGDRDLQTTEQETFAGDETVVIIHVEAAPLLQPSANDYAAQAVATGANDFAFRLSALLAQDAGNDNLIVSPYSVWLPLAALLNATDEVNRDALLEALGAGGVSVDDVNRAASRMLFDLTNSGTGFLENQLHIANAVFVDHNLTLRRDFAQTFADYFRGTVMEVDFASHKAVDAVNQWASDNTDGLITDIIERFNPLTVAAIANAIYFQDRWLSEFNPALTRQDVFHSPTGASTAYFMQREAYMFYFEDDILQAVRLPFTYGGGLYILLPRYGGAVDLLSNMTAEYFLHIFSNSHETPGKLLLPRFSLESKIDLPETLIALGVPLFCAVSAPLTTGLVYENSPLWVEDAVQKAVIEVDEKGTTAAAVTVMDIPEEGPPPSPFAPFEMLCDRPFVFVLYQTTLDGGAQVLFSGMVNQPIAVYHFSEN